MGKLEAFFVGDEVCVKEFSQNFRGVCVKNEVMRCFFFLSRKLFVKKELYGLRFTEVRRF
jgi:hypothetical protein